MALLVCVVCVGVWCVAYSLWQPTGLLGGFCALFRLWKLAGFPIQPQVVRPAVRVRVVVGVCATCSTTDNLRLCTRQQAHCAYVRAYVRVCVCVCVCVPWCVLTAGSNQAGSRAQSPNGNRISKPITAVYKGIRLIDMPRQAGNTGQQDQKRAIVARVEVSSGGYRRGCRGPGGARADARRAGRPSCRKFYF